MEQGQGAKAREQEEVCLPAPVQAGQAGVVAVEAAEAEVEWAAIDPGQGPVVSAGVRAVAQKWPIK